MDSILKKYENNIHFNDFLTKKDNVLADRETIYPNKAQRVSDSIEKRSYYNSYDSALNSNKTDFSCMLDIKCNGSFYFL